jgi:hypothetical protein
MDGGQLTAVIIVALIVIGSVLRAGARGGHRLRSGCGANAPVDQASTQVENARLRDEVQGLKERIKVLERITVEKENSLAKEIESLRDR